jgi:DNA-binding MarR family transcriptional regulator
MIEGKTAYKEWEDAVRDYLLIVDKHIIKLIPALLITHRLPGDPVWSFLVAPPGGAKTEFIKAMNDIANVYPISSLTSKTLVSGARMAGGDTSLLLKVQNGYFTFEDFTTLLAEKEEASIIMGQLRGIYGGKFDKDFGTGQRVQWEGKITLIAGATYAIHGKRQVFSNMGERFMIYNIQQPDRTEVTMRAIENHERTDINRKRGGMGIALKNLVDVALTIPDELPRMSMKHKRLIAGISEFTTRARSSVERDYSSQKKEIVEVYPPEMPTRLAAQLLKIAHGFMVINEYNTGSYDLMEEDIDCLKRLGLDCVSPVRRLILIELAKYEEIEGPGLAMKLNLPSVTTDRYLQDFDALGLVNRTKGGRSNIWVMKPNYREIVASIEHIEVTKEELTVAGVMDESGLTTPEDEFEGF